MKMVSKYQFRNSPLLMTFIIFFISNTFNFAFSAELISPYAHAIKSKASLMDYWRLNEPATSKVALNEVPGRSTGTFKGGVSLSADGFLPGQQTSMQLDGQSGSYIDVGTVNFDTLTDKVSVEAWVYMETCNATYSTIFARPGVLALDVLCSTQQAQLSLEMPGGEIAGSSPPLKFGQWYHVVGTYDGTAINVYADAKWGDRSPAAGPLKKFTENALIGASYSGTGLNAGNWHGRIDEVAIYSKALNSDEVRGHYIAGLDTRPYVDTNATETRLGQYGQRARYDCKESFGWFTSPINWSRCKRRELTCDKNMVVNVNSGICGCNKGMIYDMDNYCVEPYIASDAVCGRFSQLPCLAGSQPYCDSTAGLQVGLGVCQCPSGKTVTLEGKCVAAHGKFGFADFDDNYYIGNQVSFAKYIDPHFFDFDLRAPKAVLTVGRDSVAWLKGYASGTCLTGIVDTSNSKLYVYPVTAVLSARGYNFNCPNPVAISGKKIPASNPIIHNPDAPRSDSNNGPSHLQLMYRKVPGLDVDSLFAYEQGIGFFVKKIDSKNFVIDYSSRSLGQFKFSYNGNSFDNAPKIIGSRRPCGVTGRPRCYPTKDWRDLIRDSLDNAVNPQTSLPTECSQISNGGAGVFTLYLDGRQSKPYPVYCTASGETYLELSEQNYSSTLDVGGHSVRTEWSKIRFDPSTKKVTLDDFTFSRSQGWIEAFKLRQVKYGGASDCKANNSKSGRARIDLGGLPFAVDLQTDWQVAGWNPNGSINFSDDRAQVDVHGGGFCGGQEVVGDLKLKYLSIEDRAQVVFGAR